jgi:hypothetical protein
MSVSLGRIPTRKAERMTGVFVLVTLANLFVLLLGVSVGRALITLRIRREDNRRRELELELMEQRSGIIERGKMVAANLEDLIYRAQVQQEIDKLIRKKGAR